ncbi:hypothetical protein ACHAXH_009829, partial [Discostella pseudostelligera]
MVTLKCIFSLSAVLQLLLIMSGGSSSTSNSAAVSAFVSDAPHHLSSPSSVDASWRMTYSTTRLGDNNRLIVHVNRSGFSLMNSVKSNNGDHHTNESYNNYEWTTSTRSLATSSPHLVLQRMSRRSALFTTVKLSSILGLASITSRPEVACASTTNSDLFKPNPLTNPLLEQIRIWNQDEADNIKYGGELASGSDGPPSALDQYATLLQPILGVEYDLARIDQLLRGGADTTSTTKREDYLSIFTQIDTILSSSSSLLSNKLNFKKAFNAFADNIYYSDPDRANLYLGGGAIPKTSQSIAYLLRNEVLTTVEDMRAEVQYLLKELNSGKSTVDEIVGESDVYEMSKLANEGMKKYLDLVPPKELEVARAKF